ncbi:uncharacterized protein LOC112035119 [Quercus suber]|uniref:uncharacterized protein LOC112035119 n=1 Tax=Quercus suber TaxID=58331 RepID=UPI000CE27786|nr:uncharacterized protein LOC112035119 [Quercus suber]
MMRDPEDVVHALWLCKEISCVWLSLEWFHQAVPVQPLCFRELLSRFMYCPDEFRAEIFVTTAWSIWNRRIALHFGRSALPVDQICSSAGNFLQEFLAAQDTETALPNPPSPQRWCPPMTDVCKVNFDAAVFRSSNLVGLGVVVRDSSGAMIGALSAPTPLGSSVAELEALACMRAVQFASEIGLTRVVFEGDSTAVIKALREGLGELTCYGNVLDDIREHVSVFQSFDFNLVSRLCNSVADALAKKASSVEGVQVWLGDLPADIAPFLFHDVH